MTNKTKTLIVEDNLDVLSNFEIAYRLDVLGEPKPIRLSEDPVRKLEELGIDVTQTYREAEEFVGLRSYGFVLLDHNLPRDSDQDTQGIGYSLIPKIRQMNPRAIIIGTSSERDARGKDGLDYELDKSDYNFGEGLKEIYETEGEK